MTLHSPTRFALGEVFTANGFPGKTWAIIASLADDGHSGDLVLIPDGTAQRVNRAELRPVWTAVDTDCPWYIECWSKDGRAASWHANVPSALFVLALAKYARGRGLGEIVRFIAPNDAAPADLDLLSQFRVERT